MPVRWAFDDCLHWGFDVFFGFRIVEVGELRDEYFHLSSVSFCLDGLDVLFSYFGENWSSSYFVFSFAAGCFVHAAGWLSAHSCSLCYDHCAGDERADLKSFRKCLYDLFSSLIV